MTNNVNIKGKDYEIDAIINSFKNKHDKKWSIAIKKVNSRISDFGNDMNVTSKLCIEASKQIGFDMYEVDGITFCFNSNFPCYTSYRTVINKMNNSMFFFDDRQIIRKPILLCDNPESKNQECIIPEFDSGIILDYIERLSKCEINDIKRYIGSLVMKNISNHVIIDNMKINISYNDIMKGFCDMLRWNKLNKYIVYSFICRSIMDKRDRGKDLNWFMFKILLISKIV